jgi:hypothetical protein
MDMAWTLFPRPILPVVVPVATGVAAADFAAAAAAHPLAEDGARFAIDLGALAAGADATRPVLVELAR